MSNSISGVTSNSNVYNTGSTGPTSGANRTQSPDTLEVGYLNADALGGIDDNSLFTDSGDGGAIDYDALAARLDGLNESAADIFTLMALMIQMAKEQREGARFVRDAERATQQAELQNAADQMREAADMALAAAIVSGVFKIASGAISIGAGMHGLNQLRSATKPGADLPEVDGDGTTPTSVKSTQQQTDLSSAMLETIRSKGRIFDGSGQMVSGIGEMIAAGFTRESSEQTAEQKEAEAAAQLAETGAQREQDFLTQLTDLINKITSLMQDIQQTNNESARRAASV